MSPVSFAMWGCRSGLGAPPGGRSIGCEGMGGFIGPWPLTSRVTLTSRVIPKFSPLDPPAPVPSSSRRHHRRSPAKQHWALAPRVRGKSYVPDPLVSCRRPPRPRYRRARGILRHNTTTTTTTINIAISLGSSYWVLEGRSSIANFRIRLLLYCRRVANCSVE